MPTSHCGMPVFAQKCPLYAQNMWFVWYNIDRSLFFFDLLEPVVKRIPRDNHRIFSLWTLDLFPFPYWSQVNPSKINFFYHVVCWRICGEKNLGISTLNTGFCPSNFLATWLAVINKSRPVVPTLWFLEHFAFAPIARPRFLFLLVGYFAVWPIGFKPIERD